MSSIHQAPNLRSESQAVPQSLFSCARCRQKKIKCDKRLPSCSQCTTANTTCVGCDTSQSGTNAMPRDLIQYLESEIANQENEIARNGDISALLSLDEYHMNDYQMDDYQDDENQTTREWNDLNQPSFLMNSQAIPLGQQSSPERDLVEPGCSPPFVESLEIMMKKAIIASPEIRSLIYAYDPHDDQSTSLMSNIRLGLTPSRIIPPSRAKTAEKVSQYTKSTSLHLEETNLEPQTGTKMLPARVLLSLPQVLIQKLVTKFCQRYISVFLVLPEDQLRRQVDRVSQMLQECTSSPVEGNFGDSNSQTPMLPLDFDVVVVYLVLAISLTLDSFKGGFADRCMDLSADLFDEGVRYLFDEDGLFFGNNLLALQVVMLVLNYALINPGRANIWIFSGIATRLCLKLGLDRETPWTTVVDKETVEQRRQLFWAWYCLESSIRSSLLLPVSIPDESITTQLPIMSVQNANTRSSDLQPSSSSSPSILLIQYHRQRNLIMQVQFQNAPLPTEAGGSFESWLSVTETRVRTWFESCVRQSQSDVAELTEYGLAHTLILLHRPSLRNPHPSDQSMLTLFESASTMGRILHHDNTQGGFLRRRYLSGHHTFDIAMLTLFCLRHGGAAIRSRYDFQQIFEVAKLFTSNFLALAAQGWTDVATFAGTYECLLAPVLNHVLTAADEAEVCFPAEHDEQLKRWISPGQNAMSYETRLSGLS